MNALAAGNMATETSFEYTEAAPSGSLAGDYLWSDPNNWSPAAPVEGDSVTVPYDSSAGVTFDDLAALSVSTLTVDGGGGANELDVMDGTLAIGTLASTSGFADVVADSSYTGTGVVTIGSLAAGVEADLVSYGSGALLLDSSPTSSDAVYYDVDDGGMLEFTSGSPIQEMDFDPAVALFGDLGGGTYAFRSLGSIISAPLDQVDAGAGRDSIELPGTAVLGAAFGSSSMQIVTNVGTYDFTDVQYTDQATSYASAYDASTQLVKITLSSNSDTLQYSSVGSDNSVVPGGYLWSNAGNWTQGLPTADESITVPYSSTVEATYDDLAALSVTDLTLSSSGEGVNELDVMAGTLAIGLLATSGNYAQVIADSSYTGTGVVSIGSLAAGLAADLESYGAGALLVDSSATDTDATSYDVDDGGMMEFTAGSPTQALNFDPADPSFGDAGGGIYAFRNPGSLIATPLDGVDGGEGQDSIELPGTAVLGVAFGASSLTVVTNLGTYDFTHVQYAGPADAYSSSYDANTQLVKITLKVGSDTFQYSSQSAGNGSIASGAYLWSSPGNWNEGVPTPGESVTVPYDSAVGVTFDDLANLSVTDLTLEAGAYDNELDVLGGTLAIGVLATTDGVGVVVADAADTGTGVVSIGSLAAGVAVDLVSDGAGALLVDSSPTDTGTVDYDVAAGGMLEFTSGSPTQGLNFAAGGALLDTVGEGTYAFKNPGSLISTALDAVDGGSGKDSLELPGTAVLGVTYGSSSLNVVTNAGTYDFTNVQYTDQPTAYSSAFDASTQLVEITLSSGTDTFQYDSETPGSSSLPPAYLWSNPANWTEGVPPADESATVPYDGSIGVTYDDLAHLNVPDLTLEAGAYDNELDVMDGTLVIGMLATTHGVGVVVADASYTGTGVVSIGSLAAGIQADLVSYGTGALLVDSSATDSGTVDYDVADGGLLEFTSGSPTQGLDFAAGGTLLKTLGEGTYAFENPGYLISTALDGVDGSPGQDSIELPGTSVLEVTFGTGSLTVVTNLGTYDFTDVGYLNDPTGYRAAYDPSTQLVDITIACYRRGTHILTPHGERPIEELAVGDRVATRGGASRPIRWIGHRRYDAWTALSHDEVMPIVIQAGALAAGIPRRDLHVSPHHALYLDGVLVEAHDLTNGVSIYQLKGAQSVEYFHLELDSHDVLFAEGAPAESYVDEANRDLFDNVADYLARFGAEDRKEPEYCAPRLAEGWDLEDIRMRLLRRARSLLVCERLPLPATQSAWI